MVKLAKYFNPSDAPIAFEIYRLPGSPPEQFRCEPGHLMDGPEGWRPAFEQRGLRFVPESELDGIVARMKSEADAKGEIARTEAAISAKAEADAKEAARIEAETKAKAEADAASKAEAEAKQRPKRG